MKTSDVSPSVLEAARCLQERYGPYLAALMAYGSRVFGQARSGSAYDFWVIVNDLEAFHRANAEFYRTQLNHASTPEEQIALNRAGPNFYAFAEGGFSIKIAVLGQADFVALCRDDWWTVKGRMQKPLGVIQSTPEVDAALLAARREALACGLNLVPKTFTMEALLTAIVSLSYRAEIRPEAKQAKIRSIIEAAREQLTALYEPLLAEVDSVTRAGDAYRDNRSDDERRLGRKETLRALRRSKWCARSWKYIWRNYRSHGSPLRYIGMKVVGEFEKAFKRLFGKKKACKTK